MLYIYIYVIILYYYFIIDYRLYFAATLLLHNLPSAILTFPSRLLKDSSLQHGNAT